MDLFITNLPEGATEDLVRGIFSDYGAVAALDLQAGYDRIHGTWHAHCYVTMPNDAEASAAMFALSGTPWGGRRLCVATTYRRPVAIAPA